MVLQLRKDLPVHEDCLQLPLPIPVADVVIPGQLVINSVPAIALSPRATEMTGLAPEFVPVSQPMPEKLPGNERRVFRVFLPEATFVADRTIRARELQLDVHTAIEAGIASCSVEQLFHYRSRYQPMQRLILELPTDRNGDPIEPQFELLQKSNQTTLTESVLLEFTDVVEENDAQLNQQNRQIQLLLPQPQLGQFEVRSSFCVDGLTVADDSAVRRVVPLIKPLDGELENHRLLVNTPSSLKLLLGKPEESAPWRAESQQRNGTWNELRAVTGESVSRVVLVSKQAEQFARLSTIVEKIMVPNLVCRRFATRPYGLSIPHAGAKYSSGISRGSCLNQPRRVARWPTDSVESSAVGSHFGPRSCDRRRIASYPGDYLPQAGPNWDY